MDDNDNFCIQNVTGSLRSDITYCSEYEVLEDVLLHESHSLSMPIVSSCCGSSDFCNFQDAFCGIRTAWRLNSFYCLVVDCSVQSKGNCLIIFTTFGADEILISSI